MERDEWVDRLEILFSKASYAISGGLVIGDFMHYLNENAAAFGVILGFMTFLLNAYYSHKKHKAYLNSLDK